MIRPEIPRAGAFAVALALATTGCTGGGAALFGTPAAEPAPSYVSPSPPADAAGEEVLRAADAATDRRILISLEDRFLWLLEGRDTLLAAPVAVGMNEDFSYGDKSWRFETPQGRRTVRAKAEAPVWVPPEWHYLEIAAKRDLEPVYLEPGQTVELEDGTSIQVRGKQVGRINAYGNFWPFTPGTEIIFDGRIFVPPFGTEQRRILGTLGTRKLDTGDGYLIHGTDERDSIGRAASHGCVRLRNEDVERLYAMVPVGTSVYVY